MQKKELELNKSLKLLAKTSFIVFAIIVLSKLLTYFYKIIVARYYGPEVYGLLALSLIILGWLTLFSHFGLENGILRYLSFYRGKKDNNKISYIVKFSLNFLFITGILAGILLFFLSDLIAEKVFSNSQLSIFLKILSLTIPFTALKTVFFELLQAHEKIGLTSFISKILDPVTKVITITILIYIGINFISIPISYLLAGIITLLFSYLFCKIYFKKIFKIKQKKNKQLAKNLFSYSWPLIFFSLSLWTLHSADSFMIGIFKTVEDVGFYNVAIPISLLLTVSIDLFNSMFFPLVTKEYARRNIFIVKQLSQQTGKWVYMLSLPLFILLIIFPGIFIKILFGEEYLIASNALRFLSVGAMFTAVFEVSKRLILMKGKSKLILKITLFALVLNIILNLILIPSYGITGAAIATMISLIFLGLIFAFQSWKLLRIVPLRRKMINITIVALIPTGALLLIKQIIEINLFTLIVLGILFICLYILLILLTGCLDKNDNLILDLIKDRLHLRKKIEPIKIDAEGKDL